MPVPDIRFVTRSIARLVQDQGDKRRATIQRDVDLAGTQANPLEADIAIAPLGSTGAVISLRDNDDYYDQGFVPFGEVVEGTDTVDELEKRGSGSGTTSEELMMTATTISVE